MAQRGFVGDTSPKLMNFLVEVGGVKCNLRDYSSLDDLIEYANSVIDENEDEDECEERYTIDDIYWGYSNIHEYCQDDSYSEYIACVDRLGSIEEAKEIIDAGLECGLGIFRLDDRYMGQCESNADFAKKISGIDQSSLIWPYTCIDWDMAYDELAEYTSLNVHYFRI